jgi:cytidine deaminase
MINKDEFWSKYKSCEIYNVSELPEEMQTALEKARTERNNAYAPYSKYGVCAIIVTENENIIDEVNSETCNIDSICAEAGAIDNWTKIVPREKINYVIVAGIPLDEKEPREDVYVTPCGRCRQRLYEHCADDTIIIGSNEPVTKVRVYKMCDLLPFAFRPENLG